MEELAKEFNNKVILVTGGTGSIGSEIVKRLLEFKPKQVRVYSRNDSSQYHLLERFNYHPSLRMLIGDIRDKQRLDLAMKGVDIVFHTAAIKHVSLCEYNPFEAVASNIIGSQNVIDAAHRNGVKKIIAISTDKVANPVNVLGVSKLMMEKLFINSDSFLRKDIKLCCVRFGNVAWANGSVLPSWTRQAQTSGEIKVTDKKMTRFMMSIDQAVDLTLRAAQLTQGGEIFVFKMPSIKLGTLANLFINKYFPDKKIKIKETGHRKGEKMHEDLIGANDLTSKIWSDKEMLILISDLQMYDYTGQNLSYPGFKMSRNPVSLNSNKLIDSKKVLKFI